MTRPPDDDFDSDGFVQREKARLARRQRLLEQCRIETTMTFRRLEEIDKG
jgi:hypothetical protein